MRLKPYTYSSGAQQNAPVSKIGAVIDSASTFTTFTPLSSGGDVDSRCAAPDAAFIASATALAAAASLAVAAAPLPPMAASRKSKVESNSVSGVAPEMPPLRSYRSSRV